LFAAGTNTNLVGAPGATVSVAVALVSPADVTVTVAVPGVVGVKLDAATPFEDAIDAEGENEPDTPLTANAT